MNIKKFLFKKISIEKGTLLLLIVFFLAIAIIVQDTRRSDFSKLMTGFIAANIVGDRNNAVLSLSPISGSYGKGREFSVNVLLNTNNQNAVVAGVYLNYDPTKFKALNIDTSGSVFNTDYEIVNYNGSASYTPAGKIEIIESKPTPGVKTGNGLVAAINFKALSLVNPNQDNLTFDFASSSVILDDGQGTNILSGTNNAKFTITAPSLRLKVRLEGKKKHAKRMYIKMLKLNNSEAFSSELEVDPDDVGDAEKSDAVLTNLSDEDYKLFIRIPGYLKKRMTITWPPSGKFDFGEFAAGDIDGDNKIDSSDWNKMKSDWGAANVLSDINEDGIVNALDWSFLNKNWEASGDN